MPEERDSNTALVVLVVVLIAVLLAVLLFWRTANDDDIEIDLPDTSSLVRPAPSLVSAISMGARVVYRG